MIRWRIQTGKRSNIYGGGATWGRRRQGAEQDQTGTKAGSRVFVLVIAFTLGISASSYADQTRPSGEPPQPTPRCRALNVAQVHTSYADFERAITAWMATGVTSRSGDAHREVKLVRDNRSLHAVWQALAKGQPARIAPHYKWARLGSFKSHSPRPKPLPERARDDPPGDQVQTNRYSGALERAQESRSGWQVGGRSRYLERLARTKRAAGHGASGPARIMDRSSRVSLCGDRRVPRWLRVCPRPVV